ncbi:MAG: hypothetical protein M1531_00370 [Chloroflexi bacterium]|nr:hypothetical protein [Chloroflexota bacterium]
MKKRLLIPFALLAVLAMLLTSLPAAADPPVPTQKVTTTAQITGDGAKPGIKAKWELPSHDMSLPGVGIPPVFVPPAYPNPADVCVWAVVTDTMGIANISGVFFDVWEPATPGEDPPTKFKIQVHMVNVTDTVAIEAAKTAAVNSGQMTSAQKTEIDEEILKFEALAYKGCFDYDVHQLSGKYKIVATVTNNQGATGSKTNYIMIDSIVSLAIDFTVVDYGSILPGVDKWKSGDGDFTTVDKPTVWNRGNNPGALNIVSSPMTGITYTKVITVFDVMLSSLSPTPKTYYASQVVTPDGKLQPCNPTQIDFSIHAPSNAPQDAYTGTMTITIVEDP